MTDSRTKKIITISLIILVVLSAATFSFAMQDMQHKSNEFRGLVLRDAGDADLTITKTVVNLEDSEPSDEKGDKLGDEEGAVGAPDDEGDEEVGNDGEEGEREEEAAGLPPDEEESDMGEDEEGAEEAGKDGETDGSEPPNNGNPHVIARGLEPIDDNHERAPEAIHDNNIPMPINNITDDNLAPIDDTSPIGDTPPTPDGDNPVGATPAVGRELASDNNPVGNNMTAFDGDPAPDPNQTFTFTVTFTGLSDGPITVYIDGDPHEMEIIDGKLTIELKDGQTAVIKNLPVGTGYSIVETPVENYAVGGENHHGIVPEEGITASFINYYGGEPDEPDEPEGPEEPEGPDEPEKPEKPEKPSKPKDPERPKTPSGTDRPRTGDDSNIWLWTVIMVGSAVALRFLLRNKNNKKE
ncbi:MAG: DUF5979 domain-containing protein [Clostridiales bacterium]|nr:DUF5979 domain-containing protein [Clostridiales bacterium]